MGCNLIASRLLALEDDKLVNIPATKAQISADRGLRKLNNLAGGFLGN